jgi:hypothetical protein
MPWKTADVEEHVKGLSDKQKNVWVRVANTALKTCEAAGKSNCEASAIKQASALAKNMQEGGYVLFEAEMSDNDVRNALEQAIRAALPRGDSDGYVWVADVYDGNFVYEDNRTDTPGMYRRSYTLDADGSALLGEPTKVTRQTVYVPVEESERPGIVQRALDVLTGALRREPRTEAAAELRSDLVPLIESSVRDDGTMPIKIIAPGWGRAGYYSAELLERDGPGIYKRGTQMYMDHPTVTEANERPERSVRDLVGTLASDGRWQENGADGPGIYADAQVVEGFRDALGELAPHIGISHRALGDAEAGEAEGQSGPIVQSIVEVKSVDFVTKAAAGGKVLELMESVRARIGKPRKDMNMPTERELKEAQDGRQAAEKERDELKEAQTTQATELARLQEAGLIREAREVATEVLGKVEHLPELTQARLVESVSAKPPVKDGVLDKDAFGKALEEAAKAEIEYLAKLTKSGSIRGLGESGDGVDADAEKMKTQLTEAFQRLGLSESGAKIAVAGRQ